MRLLMLLWANISRRATKTSIHTVDTYRSRSERMKEKKSNIGILNTITSRICGCHLFYTVSHTHSMLSSGNPLNSCLLRCFFATPKIILTRSAPKNTMITKECGEHHAKQRHNKKKKSIAQMKQERQWWQRMRERERKKKHEHIDISFKSTLLNLKIH